MSGDPARGLGGRATVEEVLAHAEEFDVRNHGPALSRKPVLLVGGWRDRTASLEAFVLPMARAIEAVDGALLTPVVLDDGHEFRAARGELHAAVRRWLREECLPVLGSHPASSGDAATYRKNVLDITP